MEKSKVLSNKPGLGFTDWLMNLAISFNWPKLIRWAIKHGADIDASRLYWNSKPLIWAIRRNDHPMVVWLLDQGASITIAEGRYTPFTMALRLYLNKRVNLEIVKCLAMREKNLDKLTPTGYSPIGHAIIEEDLELLKFFLAIGANPNTCDEFGEPALLSAVSTGNIEACKLLLEFLANTNQPHKSKGTIPLSVAVWENRPDICGLLLDHWADPNIRSKSGSTALHHAAMEGNQEIYSLLLQHDADPNLRNYNGLTPEEAATKPPLQG